MREILTVFEAANLLEQQRQGVITRQLAAWAAILAVPTAIAGIYGMNFANMPELKTDYGYFIVLGVIALLCTDCTSGLRRRGGSKRLEFERDGGERRRSRRNKERRRMSKSNAY